MIRLLSILLIAISIHGQEFIPFWKRTSVPTTGNHLLPDLIAYWRFEETTGNALDSSGNGRTLTENGVVGTTVNGVVDNARSYADDEETDYFSRASESIFAFGDFTITAWVLLDNSSPSPDDKAIISRGDFLGSNFSWLLEFNKGSPNDDFRFYWSTDGTFSGANVVVFDLGGSASEADYYFVCVRRTGSSIHISATFISDPLATDTIGTSAGPYFNDGTSQLRVGDLEGSDIHDMRGNIDELSVYSRYLPDCEVAWLFTAGDGFFTYPDFDANTCVNP